LADELRRGFIKRAGIAAGVLAGSVVATAATSESKERGAGSNVGNGVVTENSSMGYVLQRCKIREEKEGENK